MMPGISARPSASIVCAAAPWTLPSTLIFPSTTARSPRRGSEPRPSRSSAPRMTSSCMAGQYTGARMELFDLHGKVAIVTGGARGIGAATATLLERAGAKVAKLDISTGCDVTNEAAVVGAFADVEKQHGSVDILVNNAGRANRKPAVELSYEEWQAVVDLNLTAGFLCSRTAQPYMKRPGARPIVNLAPLMGFPPPTFPHPPSPAPQSPLVHPT